MRVRRLDENWDWTFGQSQLNYVDKKQAIELDVIMKLKEWWQDCFFNRSNGIPWSVRLGYPNQKEQLDVDIKTVVLTVPGVFNITDFESMAIERRYRCTFRLYHQYSNEFSIITFDSNEVNI